MSFKCLNVVVAFCLPIPYEKPLMNYSFRQVLGTARMKSRPEALLNSVVSSNVLVKCL